MVTALQTPAAPAMTWFDEFARPGVDVDVAGIESFGGDIVIGGGFNQAGAGRAKSLAAWDGETWRELGGGVTKPPTAAYVYDLLALPGSLYVAGDFSTAGSTLCANIARWDGTAFHSLGTGTNSSVLGLASYGGRLVAVGRFVAAGSVNAKRVATWDGSTWQPLGGGFPGNASVEARSAVALGNDLWVGGSFATAGTTAAGNVARWDGSTWNAAGAGLPNAVSAVAVFQAQVHAAAGGLYKWDGSTWQQIPLPIPGWARELRSIGSYLYVAGSYFGEPGGLLRWDGTNWDVMPGAMDGVAGAIATDGESIYLGGGMSRIGDVAVYGVGLWTGSEWRGLGEGQGFYGAPHVFTTFDQRIVAGGNLSLVQDVVTGPVASWSGSRWEAIGPLDAPSVNALLVKDGQLFAGLRPPDLFGPGSVQSWDGSTWSAIADDLKPDGVGAFVDVNTLTVFGSQLVAGGRFQLNDGTSSRHVARFDGSHWIGLGEGPGGSGRVVFSLAEYGGELIAGGDLYLSESIGSGAARWDGEAWTPLGGLVDGTVKAMAVWNGGLYLGGYILHAGGLHVNYIVRWDGQGFHPLGSGTNGIVETLSVHDGELYVGGWFSRAGSATVAGLARWDGTDWSDVDVQLATGWGGVPHPVALYSADGALWVGGGFSLAGEVSSHGVARYGYPTSGVLPPPMPSSMSLRIDGAHPAREIALRLELSAPGQLNVSVFDLAGRRVRTLLGEAVGRGSLRLLWNGLNDRGESLPSGAYAVVARSEGSEARALLVLMR